MQRSRFFGVLAPLVVSCCGGVAQNAASDVAQQDPDNATIILSVTRPAPLDALMLAPYDPEKQDTTAGFMGGYVSFSLGQVSDRGYVWKRVRPGTYVLHSLLHQGIWDLCFAAHTQAFAASAGQTIYLGRFDPAPYTLALKQAVEDQDQSKVSVPRNGRVISYFDGVPPATLAADPEAITPAHALMVSQGFVAQNVAPASLMPANFQPGTDILGESGSFGSQTCFGTNPGMDVRTAQ